MKKNLEEEMVSVSAKEDVQIAASRKKDHIELAFQSQIEKATLDQRFYYEPLFGGHPRVTDLPSLSFLGKTFSIPVWVSSMTGGTELARTINHNLAKACSEFGMGMGLGSCRSLLYSNERFEDFNVRPIIGKEQALFANLGIAQLEQLIKDGELQRVEDLVEKLDADGLIIHVNPLQEWLQPEGDRFNAPPIETIQKVIQYSEIPVIVKEVGQGMGYKSLKALFQLPIVAVDFAANGGTNFSKLELLRSDDKKREVYSKLALVGHSAAEMVNMTNQIIAELGDDLQCKQVIISGGVKDFLDGYYLINKIELPAIYGQASGFLKHARGEYALLKQYVETQRQGLALAQTYLTIR